MTNDAVGIRRFADRIRTRDYWAAILPRMATHDSWEIPDEAALVRLEETFRREGYFQLDRIVPGSIVGHLRRAVETMHAMGSPLAFAFLDDSFWSTMAALSAVLKKLLGLDYQQLPDFWAWRLDPQREDAGWRPHRDKGFQALLPDGSPKSLTLWINLTDVTPLNGCMYVVPAHLDPPSAYVDKPDPRIPANMQDIRALPAPAGTVFGWNQAILHWGGRSSRRAIEPRISFACEFQRGDVPPWNQPLLDPHNPPSFELRLALIGKQILQYRHMYGLSESMAQVASLLASTIS